MENPGSGNNSLSILLTYKGDRLSDRVCSEKLIFSAEFFFCLYRIYNYIAILFITILTSSLFVEAGLALHTFSQLENMVYQPNESDRSSLHQSSASTFCIAGFMLSQNKLSREHKNLTHRDQDAQNRVKPSALHHEQNENPADKRDLITNSCHSSLQLIPSENVTPFVSGEPLIYFTHILLDSTQRYIFEITDPPRTG